MTLDLVRLQTQTYLTPEEAAAYTRRSVNAFRKWARQPDGYVAHLATVLRDMSEALEEMSTTGQQQPALPTFRMVSR